MNHYIGISSLSYENLEMFNTAFLSFILVTLLYLQIQCSLHEYTNNSQATDKTSTSKFCIDTFQNSFFCQSVFELMRELLKRIGALLKIIAPLSDPPSEKMHRLKKVHVYMKSFVAKRVNSILVMWRYLRFKLLKYKENNKNN